MSLYPSYTDLHNKIRENIAVGHDPEDRATLQKVKFLNDENEYWGVFCGTVTNNFINSRTGTIKGVNMADCSVKVQTNTGVRTLDIGQTLVSLIMDLAQAADDIEKLDTVISKQDEIIANLEDSVVALANRVQALEALHAGNSDTPGQDDPEQPSDDPEQPSDDPGTPGEDEPEQDTPGSDDDPGTDSAESCPVCDDDCKCDDDCCNQKA